MPTRSGVSSIALLMTLALALSTLSRYDSLMNGSPSRSRDRRWHARRAQCPITKLARVIRAPAERQTAVS